jgi:Ca-activated chloride channel homolog
MSNGFDFSVAATRSGLLTGQDNSVDILIRLQAPDQPKGGLPERQSLNLAIVIDRSGSMSGQPLHEAKRAARFMIDSMKSTDRVCLVAYDDEVRVLATSQVVENKTHLSAAISEIHSGGSTNLHGGWLRGAEEAAAHLNPGSVSRVLLLSDGQANVGLTDVGEVATQCAKLAETGVTTSTYGLGEGFNEELMLAMSRSGRGSGYYSETAESLLERFQEEFSLLSALCARNVRLTLTPLPGIRCEMLNLYEKGKDGSWRLPDLAHDGELWAAARLYVENSTMPAAGETLTLLQANAAYADLGGKERAIPEIWLTLPVLENDKFLTLATNKDAARRVTEAEASQMQQLASRAAREGDWAEVRKLLARAREMAKDSPWLGEIVENLEGLAAQRDRGLFSKEAHFAATNMSTRQRSKREFAPDFNEGSAPAFLRRMTHQGRTGHFGSDGDAESYELHPFDNYAVALIKGKRILIDTGSPLSIGDRTSLDIAGKTFNLRSQMGVTPEKLSLWMNTPIDGLLGSDTLSDFVVTLDWWQSRLTFSPGGTRLQGEQLPVELLMGTPVLQFRASGVATKGIFDTGAKISYMPKRAIGDRSPVRRTNDFHLSTGLFETDVYELQIEMAGHSFRAECGILPDRLATTVRSLTGLEWIIGTDLLRQGKIGVDLRNQHVTAEWLAD